MSPAPLLLAHHGGVDERIAVLLPVAGGLVLLAVLLRTARTSRSRAGARLPRAIRRRRVVAAGLATALLLVDVVSLRLIDLGDRATGLCRNLLFPGLGLFEVSTLLALAFMAAAIVALVAWTWWGTDWVVGFVWAMAAAVGLRLVGRGPSEDEAATALQLVRSSHEFAVVMIVVACLARARRAVLRLPGVRRLRRPDPFQGAVGLARLGRLGAVDRARAAAIVALAAQLSGTFPERGVVVESLRGPDLRRRARRVAGAARWRFRGDPLRFDNTPIRAALALTGQLSAEGVEALRADAQGRFAGVPASDPTWIRLLDGTLAAAALAGLGEEEAVRRWRLVWDGPLGLHGGHRPASLYVPLAAGGAWAQPWEHAAASAVAQVAGWGDPLDWAVLRPRALGAARRGPAEPEDERLIAAGRIWAVSQGDAQAAKILSRPTVGRDALGVALDRLAVTLADRMAASPCLESHMPPVA